MPILLMEYSTIATVELYIDFYSTLTWYRMYCVGRFGKRKKDYLNGFKQLKDSYSLLWQFLDSKLPKWEEAPAEELFQSIESVFSKRNFTDDQIKKISDLLYDFENNAENGFRINFMDHVVEDNAKFMYGKELYGIVGELMKNDHYEAAVVSAFKYLDHVLQRLLEVPPHQLYGEELINFAFAPTNGKLQLQTSSNEQSGLRNFFSGVNALFRNPSAHRFNYYDDFDASTIIAMISLMTKMASELAKKQENEKKE